jgi:hypothetical protein
MPAVIICVRCFYRVVFAQMYSAGAKLIFAVAAAIRRGRTRPFFHAMIDIQTFAAGQRIMRDYLLSYKVSPYKLARRGEQEKSQRNFALSEKERNKKACGERVKRIRGPEGKRSNLSGGGKRVKAKDVMKPPLIQNRN